MSVRQDDTSIQALRDGAELFRYVFRPGDPPLESPRPYFHPVRTLTGEIVTDCRPGDHPWHKGISWSLPNVGPDNFWGGPTYRRGDGYIQLDNNGTTRHDAFGEVQADAGEARLAERLTWVSAAGATLFTERRLISATALPDGSGWACAFQSTMRNVSGRPVAIGSPTTEGRDNAGYGGLFWRGPWLAFATPAATLLFRDAPANPGYPCQWFVRSTPFACVCPGAFFAPAVQLAAAQELTLRYDIVVASGELDTAACALLAEREGP